MSIITDLAQQAKKAAQTLAILDEAKKKRRTERHGGGYSRKQRQN